MVDWSQLPQDIIQMIAVRLVAVEDFLAFSAVCRSWRSFYLTNKWTPGPQVPWLMLSDKENSNMRGFFSLYRDKVYVLELPEVSGRSCWGSYNGWLVTIGNDQEIHLFNAFTRVRVKLPAASTFQCLFSRGIGWYQYIDKAIVFMKPRPSTANEEEFLVVAIYGPYKQLAFTKPSSSSWINVESFQYRFMDVACINNQIFALDFSGTLLAVDINSHLPEFETIASAPHQLACERMYLLESAGCLLMVCQYLGFGHQNHPLVEPMKFEVFKFDLGAREWTEFKDLGDLALFVGDNISMSVCASAFIKCRGNSIYFVSGELDKWWRCGSGVYNMADGNVEPLYFAADCPSYYSHPVWVTPMVVYSEGH